MKNTALIIIDVQNLLIQEQPYHVDKMIATINEAIHKFRQANDPILFVQHTNDELIQDSKEWQVSDRLDCRCDDIYILKKYNSMFKETRLEQVLVEKGIEKLVIAGMQVEYCVDTSIKVAFEKNFENYVLEDAVSTFDSNLLSADLILKHYQSIWSNRFASFISIHTLEKMLHCVDKSV